MINGAIYVSLLFATSHWRRIVPTSWRIFPDAWAVFVHYATFHLPPEPNGFFQYNALQQLSYFAVIFVLAPLSILTGPAMSPALVNRFSWYRRLPGNRQVGRSIHFLVLCAYVAFVIAHVTMVFITGFARNMNHIVIGTNTALRFGMYIGITGLVILLLLNVMANWATWLFPRTIQRIGNALVNPVIRLLLGGHAPRAEYTRADISPFFWPNGRMPTSEKVESACRQRLQGLPAEGLRTGGKSRGVVAGRNQGDGREDADHAAPLHPGLVGHRRMGRVADAGVDETGPSAAGGPGGPVLLLQRGRRRRAVLRQPHDREHAPPAGAARLRDELSAAQRCAWRSIAAARGNQLGFKMVKWIEAIEFAKDVKHVYKGEGGYAEDNEFFDSMADI